MLISITSIFYVIMKNIVILGGGISGLALLWYLKKRLKNAASIILLEKSSRVGGWIRTIQKEGFLFEQGPHSYRGGIQGRATLQLIEELGLQEEVITANPVASQRFLYLNKQLQQLPNTIFSFLFSPLTRNLILNLAREWRIPPGVAVDESIYSFFSRRIGKEAVETFLDPLTSGIYAGNIHELSARSCFSILFEWERQYGSLLKGFFMSRFSKNEIATTSFIKKMEKKGLFSFKNGMEVLPKTLTNRLKEHILTEHEVNHMHFNSQNIELKLTNGKILNADRVYSALPPAELSSLLRLHYPQSAEFLRSIPSASIATINLGYKQKILSREGFGYLVPSKEKESILGMIWDSSIFPQQAGWSQETRLTAMIGGTRMNNFSDYYPEDFLQMALKAVSSHLNIDVEPDVSDIHIGYSAIPQYTVGYEEKKSAFFQTINPNLKVLGSCFHGISINDCITVAKALTNEFV